MTQAIEFSDNAAAPFPASQEFHTIKEAAHEHLLTRIEGWLLKWRPAQFEGI